MGDELVAIASAAAAKFLIVEDQEQVDKVMNDELVSFLPLAWVGEQVMSVSSALSTGLTVNFPEEPETVTEDVHEIAPQVMCDDDSVLVTIEITYQDGRTAQLAVNVPMVTPP